MPYKIWIKCPKCEVEVEGLDHLEKYFGIRNNKGKRIPQSQCRKCRSEK